MFPQNDQITELRDYILTRIRDAENQYALIPYVDLKAFMPNGVLNHSRLNNVREKLRRDHNLLFVTIRGEGIRLMTDEERAVAAQPHLRSIRNHCRKAIKKTNTVEDVNELSNDAYAIRGATRAVALFVEDATRSSKVKKVSTELQRRREDNPGGQADETVESIVGFYKG
jgi:hypothetical protein